MCAIAGVIGAQINADTVQRMLKTMERRGPDGRGSYVDQDTTILHTRLAIIDPQGGTQPMSWKKGNEEFIISYNGELYNTEDIRKELSLLGHSFVGHSDTEVLLHAYCEWGQAVVEKLNGIFAFAVWHVREKKLFLARDRMGVKPLFYSRVGQRLVFASEIKTVLASGLVEPILDERGIGELVLLGPGRTPGSGVFRDIEELEPGCFAFYQNGRLTVSRYWKLLDRPHTETFIQTAETVRWLVTDSIKRQMVSDVPIGTFLSGGLDSSLITAICAREHGGILPTFSVDYENNDLYFTPGKFQPNADREYISVMKRTLSTDHHLTVLTPDTLVESLKAATEARDLPGMADVDFSLLAFCGHIRPHVKVALSGECADEIFGGYPWYRDPEVRDLDGFPWAQNTAYRAGFLNEKYRIGADFVRQRYLETIQNADILPENNPVDRRTKEMVNLNVRWFMQTLLDRKDRMSMYHGLEVRVPFCDHRIAEYLYAVPWEMKDHNGFEKGLLRTAMFDVLPEKVLWRKKSPYPKTHDPRYGSLVESALKCVLENKGAPLFAIVSRDAIKSLLEQDHPWPWYGQLMRRPQTIAYFLQFNYWLEAYGVKIC